MERFKRYREVFLNSNDGIAIIDTDGIYLEQNPAHRHLLGYSDADLKGKSPEIHLGRDAFHTIYRALEEKGSYRGEVVSRKKSGTPIRIDISAFAVADDDGRTTCYVAIKRDLSSRKQVEEVKDALHLSQVRYEAVLEYSPDPVVIYDIKGRATYINPAFTRVFGWTPVQLLGDRIDFVPEENWPETREMIAKVMAGESFSGYETRRYTRSGTLIDVSVSGATYRDEKGQPIGSIINLRDITGKKQLEAQLFQAHKMEAVGTLAGGIAHDFNNILQAISGYTQILMLDKAPDSPEHRTLRAIEKSSLRASELTRQLLIFGRKVESELRIVDLNHEVRQVARILERTLPKMIAVEVRLEEALPAIKGDPVQLEQTMMNLGVNARDAMADGGRLRFETGLVRLDRETCRNHWVSKPGTYVRLSVSDTGHGIDTETMRRIFEPFYTTKETGKGTGLGLSMVYSIVQGHGGEIACTSEPGRGTTFDIYFPARKPAGVPADGPSASDDIQRGKETVLLVDDERIILDIGTHILERFGYTVVTAESGEEALARYGSEKGRFDLVILDISMPGMGGSKCLRELLRQDPAAKVIIASGYASKQDETAAMDAGAAGFVGKPYNLNEMMNKVRAVLDA